MKTFLKDNIAIIAAIILPLLLVILFMASTAVTNLTVDDPQHDFLLATEYRHNNQNALRFDVVQGRLVVTYRYPVRDGDGDGNRYRYQNTPRLWRVHIEDMSIEEIAIPLPDEKPADDDAVSIELDVPDLQNLELVNRQPGPDGYTFEHSSRRYHGNLMTELFSYDSHYSGAALTKNGRTVPIKGQRKNQYRHNTEFIGWIVSE